MKNLTRFPFCTFACILILSCDPDDINEDVLENNSAREYWVPLDDVKANDQGQILDDKKG